MGGSSKHVLPVYLDGATQTVSDTGTNDWNGLSSSVTLSAASGTFRLPKPNHYGTIVRIKKTGAVGSNVAVKPYIDSVAGSVIKTVSVGETLTVLYNGTTWVSVAESEQNQLASVASGGALTLSSSLNVNGAVTLGNSGSNTITVKGTPTFQQKPLFSAGVDINASSDFGTNTLSKNHFMGTLHQDVVVVDKNAQDATLTAQEIVNSRFIVHTVDTADGALTTPTAAQMVAQGLGENGVVSGWIHNDAATDLDCTVTAGTGVTLVGKTTILQNEFVQYFLRCTDETDSSEAVTMYIIG